MTGSDDEAFDALIESAYAEPGAFTASIGWYRAGAGAVASSLAERAPHPAQRIPVPTSVLWPELDPLFPPEWADRLGDFFVSIQIRHLAGVGHFGPIEAPQAWASAIRAAAGIAEATPG